MKKKESPFYNEAVERALEQRAREDLERKAMEKPGTNTTMNST